MSHICKLVAFTEASCRAAACSSCSVSATGTCLPAVPCFGLAAKLDHPCLLHHTTCQLYTCCYRAAAVISSSAIFQNMEMSASTVELLCAAQRRR